MKDIDIKKIKAGCVAAFLVTMTLFSIAPTSVAYNLSNHPTKTPCNPYPSNGATNIKINAHLSWTSGDPDAGDTVTYDVYFGTTNPPTTKVSNHQIATTYDPGTLAYNTHYYWKIIAWDNHGAHTAGPVWSFTANPSHHNYPPKRPYNHNHPPKTPCNPYPSDGATNIKFNVHLSWTGGDPDERDTVTYDVYFGTTNPPTTKVSNHQTATTYNPGKLAYNTHYYWKIIAWDNHGAHTAGPVWSFTTSPSHHKHPPKTPCNPYPCDRATNIKINVHLSWTCGDPDERDTVTYDVYFGTTNPPTTKVSNNQTATTYNPGTLAYNTHYYWKIIAWNKHGAYTAGPVWSFTTRAQNVYTLTLTTSGTGSGTIEASPRPGPYYYGATVKIWANASAGSTFNGFTGDLTGTTTPQPLTMNGDKTVNAQFSKKQVNNPPVFGTASPANGSSGNSLSFSWSIPINDPEGNLFSWTIQCSNGQTNSAAGAANGTKSLTLTGLTYLTPYKIWVNATDPTGSNLYIRRWYTFTTVTAPPPQNQPPIFGTPTPANGSTGNPLGFTWNIPINDPEGNSFSWSIQCSNGQTNSAAGAANGTKSLTLTGLTYLTPYKIWVNATDPTGSNLYIRRWYTFTTEPEPQNIMGITLSANTVNVGDTFTATIYLNPTVAVGGWEIYLFTFNPTICHANTVLPGTDWAGTTVPFDGGTINNVTGQITQIQAFKYDTYPNYNHTLCTISFNAQSAGTSTFTLATVQVTDTSFNLIPVTTYTATITVV